MVNNIKSVSVQPYNVIKPDSKISITFKISVEPKSAQDSIQLRGVQGIVELDKKRKLVTWKSLSPIPEGHYTFEIGELIFDDGTKQEKSIKIPLIVLDSMVDIPMDYAVHSISRVELPTTTEESNTIIKRIPLGNRPSSSNANYIELMKATDNKGNPVELAFDRNGNKVDFQKILTQFYQDYSKKFGKIHETLYHHTMNSENVKEIPVAIWIKIEDKTSEIMKDKSLDEPDSADKNLKMEIRDKTNNFADKLRRNYKIKKIKKDTLAPVVYLTLSRDQILDIANQDEVQGVFLYEREGIEDLQNSINIADSNDVHNIGIKGNGVNAAVWEDGPDVESDLVISGFFDSSKSNTSQHARLTTAIIRNKQRIGPHGHAPSCNVYSANSKDLDALRWAVKDIGCTVISQSFHRSSEPGSSTLSFDDIYKDWLILHWPYPTILQAAGNFWQGDPDNISPPSSEYVNHKGYNSLALGNHNDSATNMAGSSVFRNPNSLHGDRELPELSANGTTVSAVGVNETGTSFATPATAGIACLLQETDPVLKRWPEGCRAILLAGARRNIVDNTWWNDVSSGKDAKDGSGAVNAYQSYIIAENRVRRNGIAIRGWDVGTLSSSYFDKSRMSTFAYRVRVPRIGFQPRVKVALAWNSNVKVLTFPKLPISSNLTLDFDLMVYDENNNLVGYSGSWDNSYEIAEFNARLGKSYTIKIRRWSGTDSSWFGIAWTVYNYYPIVLTDEPFSTSIE
jgi:hypothetical protein